MKEPRSFKGVWISASIWELSALTLQEKVFYAVMKGLDNEVGCFASNTYFSQLFGLSKNRCSEIIQSLEKKKVIRINYEYKPNSRAIERRIIQCVAVDHEREAKQESLPPKPAVSVVSTPLMDEDDDVNFQLANRKSTTSLAKQNQDEAHIGSRKIQDEGRSLDVSRRDSVWCHREVEESYSKKLEENKQSLYTKAHDKEKRKEIAMEILRYLNVKTAKTFDLVGSNQVLVMTCLDAGYTAEQLCQIIDVKCEQWQHDSKMAPYLRPKTLFKLANVNNYVNEHVKPTSQLTLQDLIKTGRMSLKDVL